MNYESYSLFSRVPLLLARVGLAAAFVPATAVHAEAPAPDALSGEVTLILEGALTNDVGGRNPARREFHVHGGIRDGGWSEAWGYAQTFNSAYHDATVTRSEILGDTVRLTLEARVRPDMWIAGGRGEWTLELRRTPSPDGRVESEHTILRTQAAREVWEGTYRGAFSRNDDTFTAEGRVTGVVWDSRESRRERPFRGFDERPRLLFRAEDLDDLKRRADTPLGRALIEAMVEAHGPIGPAVAYRLTGDREHAMEAGVRMRAEVDDGVRTWEQREHQSVWWAERAMRVAFAHDLCHDTWHPETRTYAEDYMRRVSNWFLHQPWRSGSGPVTTPGAYLADTMYAGSGIAAMGLVGLRADPPRPPTAAGGIAGALQERFGAADGRTPEQMIADYEQALARWRESGGINLKYLQDARRGRHYTSLSLALGIGEGGSAGMPNLYDLDLAWRTMFGTPVSTRPIVTRAAAEPMVATIMGLPSAGRRRQVVPPFAPSHAHSGAYLSRYYALAEPDLRPAILGYWLQVAEIGVEDLATEAGARRFADTMRGDPLALFHALRHLADPPEAAPPSTVAGGAWESFRDGTYWFRAGDGPDSIVARFDARRGRGGGPGAGRGRGPDSGHFEIFGFGQHWVGNHATGGVEARPQFNAVLPDYPVNGWGRGEVIAFDPLPDRQGGAVAFDQSPAYHRIERREVTRTVTRRHGGDMVVEHEVTGMRNAIEDLGVQAVRGFAADFSGQSGAPALFVVTDRITGDHGKEWNLIIPDLSSTGVTIDGNRFTVRKGDATLSGTFVAPAGVRVDKALRHSTLAFHATSKGGAIQGQRQLVHPFTRDVLRARGPEGTEGDFVVVMTLQRGDAPEVTYDAPGPDALITVGRRTLRLDGDRIVMGGVE